MTVAIRIMSAVSQLSLCCADVWDKKLIYKGDRLILAHSFRDISLWWLGTHGSIVHPGRGPWWRLPTQEAKRDMGRGQHLSVPCRGQSLELTSFHWASPPNGPHRLVTRPPPYGLQASFEI